jgi:hypothetical protein
MIYIVPNYVTNIPTYVCPDQATIDQGQALGYTGTFVIGTQTDANALLLSSQQEYLPTVLDRFSVNKDINPDPVDTTWMVCDLSTEQPNNDIDYNVFDAINGYYNMATGLDNAKTLANQTQQNFLNWAVTLNSFATWIVKAEPAPSEPISQGTQTL